MNNSSLATIITGVVMIAILVASVGVYTYSSSSNITNSAQQQLNSAAIQMANSTLKQYEGERQRGSTVNEFIEYVKILNENGTVPGGITITYNNRIIVNSIITNDVSDTIVSNKYYTVTLNDSNFDGYYDSADITAN